MTIIFLLLLYFPRNNLLRIIGNFIIINNIVSLIIKYNILHIPLIKKDY